MGDGRTWSLFWGRGQPSLHYTIVLQYQHTNRQPNVNIYRDTNEINNFELLIYWYIPYTYDAYREWFIYLISVRKSDKEKEQNLNNNNDMNLVATFFNELLVNLHKLRIPQTLYNQREQLNKNSCLEIRAKITLNAPT